jgi:hypothetical protein
MEQTVLLIVEMVNIIILLTKVVCIVQLIIFQLVIYVMLVQKIRRLIEEIINAVIEIMENNVIVILIVNQIHVRKVSGITGYLLSLINHLEIIINIVGKTFDLSIFFTII